MSFQDLAAEVADVFYQELRHNSNGPFPRAIPAGDAHATARSVCDTLEVPFEPPMLFDILHRRGGSYVEQDKIMLNDYNPSTGQVTA